jgi:hypothetical protein
MVVRSVRFMGAYSTHEPAGRDIYVLDRSGTESFSRVQNTS